MLEQPGVGLWFGIQVVLALVGLASLGLVLGLLGVQPKTPRWVYWLAVIGSAVFCAHPGVLDALVWPALFR